MELRKEIKIKIENKKIKWDIFWWVSFLARAAPQGKTEEKEAKNP